MKNKTHLGFLMILALFFHLSTGNAQPTNSESLIPTKVVKFANLPYGDHTYSCIGVAKGFFKDVGIDLQADTIKIEEVVPSLVGGTYDAVSVPPGILFSAYETSPNLCSFVFGDLFQGFALMAQPNEGFKTYADFTKQGMSHEEAIKAVVQQLKGKVFAYPTENAIKPFIDLLLEKGGLSRSDFTNTVLDDPMTVSAMRNKKADFQVGGVPSRITLQKEGFIPLIGAADLAKGAKPSADSKELASILQDGWAVTKDFFDREHPTILRLASVNFRIMKFMQTNRAEALAIHMPYLSKVTGQKFTSADGAIIYDSLDPFITFEDQKSWFHDKNNPLYYAYVNGAILNSFIHDKIYKNNPPQVDDVIYAASVYDELEKLKASSDQSFARLKTQTLNETDSKKLAEAKKVYEAYDYYDSDRLTAELLKRNP